MKAILISIRPQWVAKIIKGIKKDEIRKGTAIGKAINKLIEEQGVAPMLIYCTKEKRHYCYHAFESDACAIEDTRFIPMTKCNGKVVARFNATAEHIEYETCSRDISGWWKDDGEMYDYKDACLTYQEMFDYIGAGEGTVVHINDLEIFDKPKEISQFIFLKKNVVINGTKTLFYATTLTRAPQSWCYIEI